MNTAIYLVDLGIVKLNGIRIEKTYKSTLIGLTFTLTIGYFLTLHVFKPTREYSGQILTKLVTTKIAAAANKT